MNTTQQLESAAKNTESRKNVTLANGDIFQNMVKNYKK